MSVEMKSSGEQFVFKFKGEHNTVVNSIRRIILDEVPTIAVEDVEIVMNESPLYDETIAHRLGLIPLSSDIKSYNFKSECKCGGVGCALCEVSLVIKKDNEGYVYSGDIKSDDPKVKPVFDMIPITKLKDGKRIEINLKGELGCGREHSKWAPAHAYLKESKGSVDLYVEPYGQLSAKDTYNKALDILVEKTKELEGKL